MKVIKKEDGNLTLELESKEEADVIWHRLNAASGVPFTTYVETHNVILPNDLYRKMFLTLDEVYTPPGEI